MEYFGEYAELNSKRYTVCRTGSILESHIPRTGSILESQIPTLDVFVLECCRMFKLRDYFMTPVFDCYFYILLTYDNTISPVLIICSNGMYKACRNDSCRYT